MAEMMTTDVRAFMDRTPFRCCGGGGPCARLLSHDPSHYRTLRGRCRTSRAMKKEKGQARGRICDWECGEVSGSAVTVRSGTV